MPLFGKDLCRLLKQAASLAVCCFLLRKKKKDQIILFVQEKSSSIELKEVVRLVTANCGTPAFLSIAQEQRKSPAMSPSASLSGTQTLHSGDACSEPQNLDGEALAESGSALQNTLL